MNLLALPLKDDFFLQRFSHQGKTYLLTVEKSQEGFDIFLASEKTRQNLSQDFIGENLFPRYQTQVDHIYITWVLFKDQSVYPCYYDSSTGTPHRIPCEGFHFLATPVIVFLDAQPRALVFLGNQGVKHKSNDKTNQKANDEIFAYDLVTRQLVNITQTPENEKVFSVIEEPGGFELRTETIPFKAVYKISLPGLQVVSRESHPKESGPVNIPLAVTPTAYNTIVGFGDSITWGKMRMKNLTGEYHPELAYLGVIETTCAREYNPINTVNLGVPGDNTYNAMERLHHDFNGVEAYFCLIMLGTNDVGQNFFSVESSIENLRWSCMEIRDTYKMYPIVSTIPPMTLISGGQYMTENTEAWNEAVIEMAQELDIPWVDTYAAFFAQANWEEMIEDIIGNHTVGNHPSPAGHQVIAGLFLEEILLLPPQEPDNFQTILQTPYRLTVDWDDNYEFDFSHYVIEFGYMPGNLNRRITQTGNFVYFRRAPYQFSSSAAAVYFRVRAEDKKGYSSGFSDIMKVEFK